MTFASLRPNDSFSKSSLPRWRDAVHLEIDMDDKRFYRKHFKDEHVCSFGIPKSDAGMYYAKEEHLLLNSVRLFALQKPLHIATADPAPNKDNRHPSLTRTLVPAFSPLSILNLASSFATTSPKYGIVTVAVGLTTPPAVIEPASLSPATTFIVVVVVVSAGAITPFRLATMLATHASKPPDVAVLQAARLNCGMLPPGDAVIGPLAWGKSAVIGTRDCVDAEENKDGDGDGIVAVVGAAWPMVVVTV